MEEAINTAPIATWVGEHFYWVMIGILILNLTQRKYQKQAQKKRFATLYLAIATFVLYSAAMLVLNYGGSDFMFLIAAAAVLIAIVILKDQVFPFRLRSRVDGRWLNFQEIFYDDGDGDSPDDASG